MHLVIFELVIPSTAVPASAKYYAFIQNLLKTQPGFISETLHMAPVESSPAHQVLIARFVGEESVRNWRCQHDHLMIEHKSRKTVFDDCRLRVGPQISLTSDDWG